MTAGVGRIRLPAVHWGWAMEQSEQILRVIRPHLPVIKERFGVRTIGLFGSWARGEASSASDVDLLVDFERSSFDAYMDLKFYLEDLLQLRVDLVLRRALKPLLRDRILGEVRDVA